MSWLHYDGVLAGHIHWFLGSLFVYVTKALAWHGLWILLSDW